MPTKKNATRVVKTTVTPSIKPSVPAKLEFKGDALVGDNLRIIIGHPGSQTEYVLHHPIGVTQLDKDDWVLSDPSEVHYLVQRRSDPNADKRKADLDEVIRQACIDSNIVCEDDNGVFDYSPTLVEGSRSDFLGILKDAKKAQGTAFNRANWLSASSDPRARLEQSLDQIKATAQAAFDRRWPDEYRTMGGPRRDVPQVALGWLKNKSRAEVVEGLFQAILHGPPGETQITEAETPSVAAVAASGGGTGGGGETPLRPYDFSGFPTKTKKSIVFNLKSIKKKTGNDDLVIAEPDHGPSGE